MVSISMKSNIDEAVRSIRIDREKIPLATAKALTFTAERVRDAERDDMSRTFDRPTPFTLNSLLLKAATPRSLESRVWFRDLGASRKSGGTATHYIEPEVYGGARPLKRFEKYLQSAGLLPAGMFAVPGEGARLDSFGNISRGQLVQVLSALRALPERGYLANRTKRSAKRKGARLINYFVGRPHPGMPMGVWQRTARGIKPVLVFVKAPNYTVRFRFFDIARRETDRHFNTILARELNRASGTLRLAA